MAKKDIVTTESARGMSKGQLAAAIGEVEGELVDINAELANLAKPLNERKKSLEGQLALLEKEFLKKMGLSGGGSSSNGSKKAVARTASGRKARLSTDQMESFLAKIDKAAHKLEAPFTADALRDAAGIPLADWESSVWNKAKKTLKKNGKGRGTTWAPKKSN